MPELESMSVHAPSEPGTNAFLALFDEGRERRLAPGEVLFAPGAPSREIYLVRSGTLDVVLATAEGGTRTLARVGPGAVVGEVAWLLATPRSAGVVARERCVLLELTEAPPSEDGAATPRGVALLLGLARLLAERVRTSNAILEDLLQDELELASDGITEDAPHPSVIVAKKLELDHVRALIEGHALAVRIPGYQSARQCRLLRRALLRHPAFRRYTLAPDVGVQRVGYSLFETQGDPERIDAYHEMAIPTMEEVRAVCAPLLTPVDRLRLELDELWPGGAQLASLDGRKMFAGIFRNFEPGHSLPPHQDVLHRDTQDPMARTLDAQLTANLYLEPAPEGGELEVWDATPTDDDAASLLSGTHDFFDRARLPPPSAVIRPRRGELVLILASRIHAVRATAGGPRISASCFIGARGDAAPLVVWS